MKLTIGLKKMKSLVLLLLIYSLNANATQYYVNSVSGNDNYNGTTTSTPWKTMTPVQTKTFLPGDFINFACGSTWSKAAWEYVLLIKDNGTAANPITFRSYGTGAKPTFSNGGSVWNKCFKISAKYVVVQDLMVTNTGYMAFELLSGADYNVIKNCEISYTGVAFMVTGQYNLLTNNYIHDLKMVVNDATPNNDMGSVCFWLYGPNNEISYNRAINNVSQSIDYQYDGGFLEFYTNCDNTYAHHNWVQVGNGLVEGTSGTANNVKIIYNVFIENSGLFAFHTPGFTYTNFKFDNNTCITAQGTLWNDMFGLASADFATISMRNNIFVLGGSSSEKVGSGNSYVHQSNIYYLLNGAQLGSLKLSTGEKSVNPMFVDMANYNLRLQPSSPAINAGTNLGYTTDYYAISVPVGGVYDIGAIEYDITAKIDNILSDNEIDLFSLYPNPAQNNLNINVNAVAGQSFEISIVNMQGQQITNKRYIAKNEGLNSIPITVNISSGMYLISVRKDANLKTKVLMVK